MSVRDRPRALNRAEPGTRSVRWTAWFLLVIGVGIAALWTMMLIRGAVPEVERGDSAIWFHIVAEFLTASLLVLGGTGLLAARAWAGKTATMALGALLYTTVASPGYYAEQREWGVVAAFGVLAAITLVTSVRTIRPDRGERSRSRGRDG